MIYPNVYGIDMPTKQELIAARANMDIVAIAKELGADKMIYQDLVDLRAAIIEEATEQGSELRSLDCSCFDGVYVTQNVGDDYLSSLASKRTANRGNSCNPQHMLDNLDGAARSSRDASPSGVRAA